MKILLIHYDDDPEVGPWATQRWDRVVDLGLAGKNSYDRWSGRFSCPVNTLQSLGEGFKDFRRIRDLLGVGSGQLNDQYGLDWWEIMSILLHGEMETTILLERLAQTIGSGEQVYVSRSGLHADILKCLLGARVQVFPRRKKNARRGIGHYVRVFNKLSTDQMADVFWDKYDAGYQLRGRLSGKQTPSTRPVVLVPTAYVNVSRTGIDYAKTFPQENFLLVATRRSGWIEGLPANVKAGWLSSYASLSDRGSENREMERRWQALLGELKNIPQYQTLYELGHLNSFAARFRHGLEVRDAWRNVLDREPVEAVLCADDSNPYTRIPLLLARARGLANIACHHGALDGRYVFKRTYGDAIWVKGKMEEDYLVRKCGVSADRVEVAAPALPASWSEIDSPSREKFKPYILFFSEASEVSGGRPQEFYRDILAPLADLALRSGRKLIVKLHPAESLREREQAVESILNVAQKNVTRVVSGPLSEDLFTNAWFGITILSTVAMECAIRGIPCFLCKWLEFWPYQYIDQFTRFGVGFGLEHPSEIGKIPEYMERQTRGDVRDNCWRPATRGRLRELIAARKGSLTASALR